MIFWLLIILTLGSVFNYSQINFDTYDSNSLLGNIITVDGYELESTKGFATNYGYNLDYSSTSLFTVFQVITDTMTLKRADNGFFNLISISLYQVGENSLDSLVVTGWVGINKVIERTYFDQGWHVFQTDIYGVNKITFSLKNHATTVLADYNFDNLDVGTATPVELVLFEANVEDNRVILKWITATEVNNYGFEIQKDREVIGFVSGAGNSSSYKEYKFIDKISFGKHYYRLRQLDTDGTYEYSREVEVNVDTPSIYFLGQNSPNPFNPSTHIQFIIPETQFVSLKVYNVLGEIVKQLVNEIKPAGVYDIIFDGADLPSGIYLYRIQTENYNDHKKMVLMR